MSSPEAAPRLREGPWLVVGLGNPGPSYAGNRHNVGYHVVDELARRLEGRLRAHKSGRAQVLESRLGVGGPRVVLGRARCFMNQSGEPVAGLLAFYKISPENLVVVHDEIDIPFETIRVKFGGGDNGHNGLRSIRGSLGTGDYYRVRVGIGRPPGRQDTADFVLSDFSSAERKALSGHIRRTADALTDLVEGGLEVVQQRYHSPITGQRSGDA